MTWSQSFRLWLEFLRSIWVTALHIYQVSQCGCTNRYDLIFWQYSCCMVQSCCTAQDGLALHTMAMAYTELRLTVAWRLSTEHAMHHPSKHLSLCGGMHFVALLS